jgi:excisionase family DNA binding protein
VIPGRSHSARYWIRTSGLRLRRPVPGASIRSQRFTTGRFAPGAAVQAFQPFEGIPKPFVPAVSPGAARATGRLPALEGGAGRLLTVRETAERLAVSTATVYGLCERDEFLHVRVSNAIRIAPDDLVAFLARPRSSR